MQTIEALVKRLDMSAEEAVEALRKLHVNVTDPASEVTDEQCDMLIEIDDDPRALDRYLKDIEKKEADARKRTEQLQKAAKKAAAKRKAAAKKKPPAKKKTPAKKAAKPAIMEEEAAPAAEETLPEAEEAPPEAETTPPVKPLVEILVEEPAPAAEDIADVAPETAGTADAPPSETDAGIEHEEAPAEVARPEAPGPEEAAAEDSQPPVESAPAPPRGGLAEAERRQEEEERRKARAKAAKPLPTPDPEVVAAVIRRAEERANRQSGPRRAAPAGPAGQGAPSGQAGPAGPAGRAPGRPPRGGESGPSRGGGPELPLPGRPQRRGATGKTARKKQKRAERMRHEETMRREAAAAVREFMAGGEMGSKRKKRKRDREDDDMSAAEHLEPRVIEVEDSMTVEQLANAMEVPVNDLILELMEDNILAHKNQTLNLEVIARLAERFDIETKAVIPEEAELLAEEPDDPALLETRAPVVTVMGHVDHGKTSFLDVVRSANVADGEAGGITQHIAAYDVTVPTGRIVFLDTPGHEAFTQMRARGAKVTDIVVLVVAADDGVRPQTIEAIDHAKAAEVPIMVAINKCDKANAEPDRVRQELIQYELVDEEWGGKTIIRNVSAKTRDGIDDLLELLALQADTMELKANAQKRARGAVIESEMSRHQGPVAWVLVQSGTLRVGDIFLAGVSTGRVRSITTSQGRQVQEAGPSTPVLVTGFSEPPEAGDLFVAVEDERAARAIAQQRAMLRKQKRGPAVRHMTLEDFHDRMLAGEQKTLNIIVKADVQGSVDVLESSFSKLGNEEVRVNIVHGGVGGVNESDVLLAGASDAVIIGFHVGANAKAEKLAEQEGVEIREYQIIYEAIDEVQKALEGMLAPEQREVVTGHAEVRAVFRSSAIGNIAGCYQLDGEINRNSLARVLRGDEKVFEGKLASLRRNKDDVKSVQAGFECGIKLEGFDAIQEGDIIESYRIEQVAKTLG